MATEEARRVGIQTAFFNLVGGRRVDSAETFRAVSSLPTVGDEVLGLFAVSDASPPGPMGTRGRRLVLDVIQREISSRFDLPLASRLRHAVGTAQARLRDEFEGHVQVGFTALLSSDESVYLLQVPPAQAYVLHDGTLHSVSPARADDSTEFDGSLGSHNEPFVCLFKDTIEPGDIVLLATSWVPQSMDADDLRSAFSEDDSKRLTKRLLEISHQLQADTVTCLALEASEASEGEPIAPTMGQPTNIWGYVDDAVGSLGYAFGRAWQELTPEKRTSKGPSRVVGTSAQATALADGHVNGDARPGSVIADEPVLEDVPGVQGALDLEPAADHATEELPVVDTPAAPGVEGKSVATVVPDAPLEIDEVNEFIRQTHGATNVKPPIQAFPDPVVVPERIYPDTGIRRRDTYDDSETRMRPAIRPRRTSRRLRTGLASAIPPAMLLWSAVGVALVLLIIGLFAIFGGGGPNYLGSARVEADKAVAAFHADRTGSAATADLLAAWGFIHQARHHGISNIDISASSAYVQRRADLIDYVFHPTAHFVTKFRAARSSPSQVATGTTDLFVLDAKRRQVYALNPATPSVRPKIKAEFGDSNYNIGNGQTTFGGPRFLAATGNYLVALDRHFNVVMNDPAPGTAVLTVEPLLAPSTTSRVVGITSWPQSATGGGNLYVLDAGSHQIWRYLASGSTYSPFNSYAQGRLVNPDPALKDATGISVAHASLYVSLRNGKVLRYTQSKFNPNLDSQASFAFHTPRPLRTATGVYARDGLNMIFVVDSADGKIVELRPSGAYIRTLVVPANLVRGMHGMTVSESGSTVYFLSGKSLFSIPVAP